jgi:hypothetical protein
MADKKQFSNTKSIVKVETGIVTLISYRHYLKIVGNDLVIFVFYLLVHNINMSYHLNCVYYRYDNVTLIPLVLQLGLRIGPIQRMGANYMFA